MSNWQNEAGEPYMTAAELAFEAELDDQAIFDDPYDDYPYGYNEGEYDDYV